jgi:hypothetical protein
MRWLGWTVLALVGCGRIGFDAAPPAALTVTAPETLNVNEHGVATAAGGTPGYTFTIAAGEGTIDAETGALVAPNHGGTLVVRVTDDDDRSAETTIEVGGRNLYVLGGWGGATTDKVYRTTDGTSWTTTNLLGSRGETVCVVFDRQLFLTGGWFSGNNIASVLRSANGETGSWFESGDLPDARGWGGAVVFQDKIVYAGGRGNASWANRDVFSTSDGKTWTKIGDLPETSTWGGLAVFRGKLWYLGGDHSPPISDAIYTSSDGAQWQVLTARLPAARAGGAIVVFQDKLWYIGGVDDADAPRDQIWSSTDGTTWLDTGARFPRALTNPAATVHDGKIWIIGGNDGGFLDTVFYSPDGLSWVRAADLPETLDRFSAISFTPP